MCCNKLTEARVEIYFCDYQSVEEAQVRSEMNVGSQPATTRDDPGTPLSLRNVCV
jgi:hypothetical protein